MLKTYQKQGFTLVELLVVIAIIGILSTIAVISLGNSKDKAVQSKIQADLRTMRGAVEVNNTEVGGYPTTTATWDVLNLGKNMPVPPGAPKGGGYIYCTKIVGEDSYYVFIATSSLPATIIKPAGFIQDTSRDLKAAYCTPRNDVTVDCSNGTTYCTGNTNSLEIFTQ